MTSTQLYASRVKLYALVAEWRQEAQRARTEDEVVLRRCADDLEKLLEEL